MPKPTPATVYQLQLPSDAVSFDAAKFDEFIRSQGVEVVHYRSMRCPVGMIDPDDVRRPHDHHENCSNGSIYTRAGVLTVAFMNNTSGVNFINAGSLEDAVVMIVLPRFYDDAPDKRVDASSFDRIYLQEQAITVSAKQTFAASVSGVDKLHFPVVAVDDLVDADGVRYQEGVDFEVVSGQIRWGQRRPGLDVKLQRGKVCSVRYNYRPYWYVKNMVHEVRVAQVQDEFTMERRVERMPQACMLQREFFFEKEQHDSLAPTMDAHGTQLAGQHPAPGSGIFGPR